MHAIFRRSYDLNLITAVQYRNAHVHFSRTKQRTSEQGEEYVPEETPEIVIDGLNLLKENLAISYGDFATSINLKSNVLQRFGMDLPEPANAVEPATGPDKSASRVISLEQYRKG